MRIFSKTLSIFSMLSILSLLIISCSSLPDTETNPPVINSFYANPPSILSGESSMLFWQVTDATTVTINQGVGSVALSGSTTVSPETTNTYTLTATNAAGSTTATTTVTVTVNEEEVGYGIIQVSSTPAGAKIFLDGVDTGKVTSADLASVEEGNHTLTLKKYQYCTWESMITLEAGEILIIDANLEEAVIKEMTIRDCIDAGVETYNADINYGELNFFAVGVTSTPNTLRAFIKFDLDEIHQDAVIINAEFGGYYFEPWGGSGSAYVDIYEVTGSWKEDQITWNGMPSIENEYVTKYYINSVSHVNSFVNFNITDLCQSWLDQSKMNYGIMLRYENEVTKEFALKFYSYEHSDDSKTPNLVIQYYVP